MQYLVKHETHEIWVMSPISINQIMVIVKELIRANPIIGTYNLYIMYPPVPKIQTVGEA